MTNLNWQVCAASKRRITSGRCRRRSWRIRHEPEGGAEFARFGLIDKRSQRTSAETVPAVSIVMERPSSAIRRVRTLRSSTSIGSPPVITTSGSSLAATRARIASSVQWLPSGCHEAYGVSQNRQRRLHPGKADKDSAFPSARLHPAATKRVRRSHVTLAADRPAAAAGDGPCCAGIFRGIMSLPAPSGLLLFRSIGSHAALRSFDFGDV